MKYDNYDCQICGNRYNKWQSLATHLSRTHKISGEDYYIKYFMNGEYPLCKCGCGEQLPFQKNMLESKMIKPNYRFFDYVDKHQYRNGNQWNTGKNLKEYWGDDKFNKWKENLNSPEVNKKISEYFKGRSKSPEHKEKILKQLAINRHNRLTSREPSYPEKLMAEYLEELNIEYEMEYQLDGFHFDFKLKDKKILIEVDGDYWHGNPEIYSELNAMQRKNRGRDKYKTKYAEDRKYKVYRFWEKDIKHNYTAVKENLKQIYL